MNYLYMILSGILGIVMYAIFKAWRVQQRYENEDFRSIARITFTRELFAMLFATGMVVILTMGLHGLFKMRADGKAIPYLPEKYSELFFYQFNVMMVLWGAFWALVGLSWFGVSEKIAKKRASEIEKKYSGD
jgi:hypothetical protein